MNNNKDKKVLKAVGLLGLLFLVIGISYAIFTVTLNGTKKVKITTGTLALRLLDEDDNYVDDLSTSADHGFDINLSNTVPEKETDALKREDNVYTFKIKNEGTINAKYTITLEDLDLEEGETRLEDKYMQIEIKRDDEEIYQETYDLTTRIIDIGLIKPNEVYTYTMRLWVKESADNNAMDKVFYAHLKLDGVQAKEDDKEEKLTVTLKNKTVQGNPEFTLPEIKYTDNEVEIKNINAKVFNPGDSLTLTYEIKNEGINDLLYDAGGAFLVPAQCAGDYSTYDSCIVYDLNNSGYVDFTDLRRLKNYVTWTNPESIREGKLRVGETKEFIVSVSYDNQIPNAASEYLFFDGGYAYEFIRML